MTVHLLGTGSADPGPDRTTTMLAVECGATAVLVDCGGDAARCLLKAGLKPEALDAIVLTHEHPDHISGYALLIEKMWLRGRRDPIHVYGPASALRVASQCFGAYDTDKWDGLPPRVLHPVTTDGDAVVLDGEDLRVTSTPVVHPVPTIGLRFESAAATLAYSADTAQSAQVVRLASGADLLLHEGTGSLPGVHASPLEAAETARAAGVTRLILVHAPCDASDAALGDAVAIVPDTRWGTDGESITLGSSSHASVRASSLPASSGV